MPKNTSASSDPSELNDDSWRKRFRRLHGRLTAAEQRAGAYFEEHPEAAFDSITDVVTKSGIGYGTIIRFCQKLGCKGFQEFKLLLFTDGVADSRQLSHPPKDERSAIAAGLISELNETLRLLEDTDIQRAAEKILKCSRILVVGVASSAPLVFSLAWKLCRLGIDARASIEGYVMAIHASMLRETDLLFAISASGATKDILHAANVAASRGVTVIALTNFPTSPLSQFAKISLLTSANRDPLKAEIPCIIAGEAVIEVLIDRMLQLEPERKENLLRSSQAVSDRKL